MPIAGAQETLAHKHLVARLLAALSEAEPARIPEVLARYCHVDSRWEAFHPFNRLDGLDAVSAHFWQPLRAALPDYEHRPGLVLANEYEGRSCVSTLGHIQGTFASSWLGIPATQGLTVIRFGLNGVVRDGKLAKVYLLLDIVDVMRQAGFYPFRRMPGSAEQWPMPPISSGADVDVFAAEQGANSLRIVREMQSGLAQGKDLQNLAATRSRHSPHWHPCMNWYGVAGIGSTRGQRGFLDHHGALFIQAFPDRVGIVRDAKGPEDGPGHYIRIGDGPFAVTGGWPSLRGTHLGGQWLGLAPSGRTVEMRVADWYRLDAQNRIVDNWVMIDVLHILQQCGLDVLDDLRYFADPRLPRWPQ